VVLRGPLASELNSKTIYLEEIVGKSSHPSPENIPVFVPGDSRLQAEPAGSSGVLCEAGREFAADWVAG
jgi:hypothetical protein